MEADERWPILRDVGISLGIGLFLATFYLFFAGGFWASWLACSGAIFFGIAFHHLFFPLSFTGAVASLVAAGAMGGTVWWLVGDSAVPAWVAGVGGAAVVGGVLVFEAFGEKVIKPVLESDSPTDPLWKRVLKLLVLLALFAIFVLGAVVISTALAHAVGR